MPILSSDDKKRFKTLSEELNWSRGYCELAMRIYNDVVHEITDLERLQRKYEPEIFGSLNDTYRHRVIATTDPIASNYRNSIGLTYKCYDSLRLELFNIDGIYMCLEYHGIGLNTLNAIKLQKTMYIEHVIQNGIFQHGEHNE